jgi:phage-related protein (TIGR01555 family)
MLSDAVARQFNSWAGRPSGVAAPTSALTRADATSACMLPYGVASGGWSNPVTGLGEPGVDPTASVVFRGRRIPTAFEIDRLYTYDWLADRIIEKMPSIALVRGVRISGQQDGGAKLLEAFEVLNTTDRFPHGAFQRGVNDGRAYGGDVMLIGYLKGQPETPLTASDAAGGIAFLDLFGQHELEVLARHDDPKLPEFGMPSLYRVIADGSGGSPHPRIGQTFHASRSIRFAGRPLRVPHGAAAPVGAGGASITGAYPEVGVSVLTPVLNDIARYGLSWSSVSNMLQDASVGVMKLGGLVDALASEDKALVEERLRLLQQYRGSHRMMFLDADNNEEYTRTEVKLTDVPAVLDKILVSVAGAADCPARILFSTSPSGLNAQTGSEADLSHFYNNCADYQRRYLGPKLSTLLTAINGGKQVKVEWPSLWEASDNERAQTRLAVANADKAYWDMGVCEASDIAKARRTGTQPEQISTPDDDRAALDPQGEPDDGPQGAPGKQGAAKIATAQRAAE